MRKLPTGSRKKTSKGDDFIQERGIGSQLERFDKIIQREGGNISAGLVKAMRRTLSIADRAKYDVSIAARKTTEAIESALEAQIDQGIRVTSERGKFLVDRTIKLTEQLLEADLVEAKAITTELKFLRKQTKSLAGVEREAVKNITGIAVGGMREIGSKSLIKAAVLENIPRMEDFVENILGGGFIGKTAGSFIRLRKERKQRRIADKAAIASRSVEQEADEAIIETNETVENIDDTVSKIHSSLQTSREEEEEKKRQHEELVESVDRVTDAIRGVDSSRRGGREPSQSILQSVFDTLPEVAKQILGPLFGGLGVLGAGAAAGAAIDAAARRGTPTDTPEGRRTPPDAPEGRKPPTDTPDKPKPPKPPKKPKIGGRVGKLLSLVLGTGIALQPAVEAVRDQGKRLMPSAGAMKNSKILKFAKGAGKTLLWPLTIGLSALDVYNILSDKSLSDEEKNVELAGVGGGIAGGAAGALLGGALGSAIFPGVGTVIGGLIGGGVGLWAGEEAVESIMSRILGGLSGSGPPKPVNVQTPGTLDGATYIPRIVGPMVRLDASQAEGARVNLLRGQRGMEAAELGGMLTALSTSYTNAVTQVISGPIKTRNDHNTLERFESAGVAFA